MRNQHIKPRERDTRFADNIAALMVARRAGMRELEALRAELTAIAQAIDERLRELRRIGADLQARIDAAAERNA